MKDQTTKLFTVKYKASEWNTFKKELFSRLEERHGKKG